MTFKNPQANAICECLHQTIGNLLCTLLHTNPPQNIADTNHLMDTALATVSYPARLALHHTLKVTPGTLVFQQDMLLDIPLTADFELLWQHRQVGIDKTSYKKIMPA